MICLNGTIQEKEENAFVNNRGFLYGDAVFETMKIVQGKILFLEDHYFRLMSGMRITRMEIPSNFTMEFLEEEIVKTIAENELSSKTARARITVYRDGKGLYTPESNEVGYLITVSELESAAYIMPQNEYEIELYKDFYVSAQLLSNVKTTNRILNVMASIFAKENDYDNCLLLNENKMLVEAINGNIFVVKDGVLLTPPLSEGCIKGIMRKQVLEAAKALNINVQETVISPFDLQKSDEIFITNVIKGIQPITKYRKKEYVVQVSKLIVAQINTSNNLSNP